MLRIGKDKVIERELSFKIVGLLYQTQNELGRYHRERQYGDCLELLLKENNLPYEREKVILAAERGLVL